MFLIIKDKIVIAKSENATINELSFLNDYDSIQHDPMNWFDIGDQFDVQKFQRPPKEIAIQEKKYRKQVDFQDIGSELIAIGSSLIDDSYKVNYMKSSVKGFMYVKKSDAEVKYYFQGNNDLIFFAETEVNGYVTETEKYYSIKDANELLLFCSLNKIDNPYPELLCQDMSKARDIFAPRWVLANHCYGISITSSGIVNGYAVLTDEEVQKYLGI